MAKRRADGQHSRQSRDRSIDSSGLPSGRRWWWVIGRHAPWKYHLYTSGIRILGLFDLRGWGKLTRSYTAMSSITIHDPQSDGMIYAGAACLDGNPVENHKSICSSESLDRESQANRSHADDQQQMLLAHLDRLRPVVIQPPAGLIAHPYCIPGGFYNQQWDWDGFFISSHLAGRDPSQPQYLKYWVLNCLASVLPNGDVATCISPEGPRVNHPSLRLKPFLAQGAELGARLLNDYSWIDEHYDEITRISTRWEDTHCIEEYGLFAWDDAMQSGADNNPAVGNDPAELRQIIACDINAFMYREYLALARLAGQLGRHGDQEKFSTKGVALVKALNDHLWDAEGQSYWNLYAGRRSWRKCVSYSNFVPLWAGMAEPTRADAMIRRYLWNEEHLLSPHGLRSLSRQDPCYNNDHMIVPYSNWQGPIWPITNYFYFIALMKHGFRDEARELVRRLTQLFLTDIDFCGSLHENYDAETGASIAPSAAQSKHGVEGGFIGWNLLLQDMIEMVDGQPNLLKLEPTPSSQLY